MADDAGSANSAVPTGIQQGTERTLADRRRLEDAIDDGKRGLLQSIGNVTITVSAASTTVTHYGCSVNSAVFLMPTTATTATEYALGTTYVTPAKGSFIITHPSNANARIYRYVFFSGIRQ
jgi:hypothetical protein